MIPRYDIGSAVSLQRYNDAYQYLQKFETEKFTAYLFKPILDTR